MTTATTLDASRLSKQDLVRRSSGQMDALLREREHTLAQKLALTCRILYDDGHASGRKAHDWNLRPRRNAVEFSYCTRRAFRDPRRADCMRSVAA